MGTKKTTLIDEGPKPKNGFWTLTKRKTKKEREGHLKLFTKGQLRPLKAAV
jgi:hypothetical protein